MREIKFRAWIVSSKKMLDWDRLLEREDRGLNLIETEDRKIMQYTGLKVGKNRWTKELYEGDIIVDERGEKFEIKYQDEWGSFIADQGELGELFFLAKDSQWTNDGDKASLENCKIIGNIYENAELLK